MHARDPEGHQQRAGLPAVRVVGGVEDLFRRDESQQPEQVDRAPDRGVEEDAALAREAGGEVGKVGDARMGKDQLNAGVRVDEALESGSDRRQTTTGVDEDRHAALGGQGEDGREPFVVEEELLGAGVELDAARAEVEAAAGLLDGAFAEVEAHERDEASLRAGGELQRPVVARSKAGVPIWLVEAEHEGPRDAEALLDLLEECGVGVEDVEVGREIRAQSFLPLRGDLSGSLQWFHAPNL